MDNCKSKAFDENICYECQPGYYLSDNGKTCTEFNATIDNCSQYVHNATSATPKCAVCDSGYTLYNDGANCWQDHVNCLKKATATTCSKCKDLFYKNDAATSTGGCTEVSSCILNVEN